MSAKCEHCSKTVYHAERRDHDGKVFHARCFNLWKKACEERERDRKNRENYDLMPDVSPSYYRVGDPSTGEHAKMVSGVQERSGSQGSQEFRSNSQDSQGIASGSAGVSAAPKFCPECGAPNEGGRFCGECGFKF